MELDCTSAIPKLYSAGGRGELRLHPGFALENRQDATVTMPADLAFDSDDIRLSFEAEVIDTAGRRVAFSLSGTRDEELFAGVFAARMEEGFVNDASFTLRLECACEANDYLFMPGAVYNTNRWAHAGGATPNLHGEDACEIALPGTAMPLPGIGIWWRERGAGFFLATTPQTRFGPVGIRFRYDVDRAVGIVSVSLPDVCNRVCNAEGWREEAMAPMYLGMGGAVGAPIALSLFDCDSGRDFFQRIRAARAVLADDAPSKPALPLSQAAELVEENLNQRHWHAPYYVSSITVEQAERGPRPGEDGFADRQYLEHGASGGAPLAYALSRSDDEATRDRAFEMLDFIAADGMAPSGLFYSLHGRWGPFSDPPWGHIRGSIEASVAFLRAIEHHQDGSHAVWRTAAESSLDALASLFREYGDFGLSASRAGKLELWEHGTGAGALGVGALALGSRVLSAPAWLETARRAATVYVNRLEDAVLNGADPDHPHAPDSATVCGYLDGFAMLYEETRDREWLDAAVAAAEVFSTFVHAGGTELSTKSAFGKLGAPLRGAVLKNAASRRYRPGPPASSLRSLLEIYRATGDEWFINLLEDITAMLPHCVSRYHAELADLRRGMVASGLVLCPADAEAGAVENISRADTALSLLLAYTELPGVYIDPPRNRAAAFDHVQVQVDFELRRFIITNPTAYPARGEVLVEVNTCDVYELLPGQVEEYLF